MNSDDDAMSDIPMEIIDAMSDIPNGIPMDMVGEILSRLPTKCLMRFSCVSKEWYDLINNNIDFLKKHLSQAKAKKKSSCSQTLLLGDSATIYSIDIDLLNHDRHAVHTLVELKPPFSDTSYISNYCNGLIVVLNSENNSLAIWNPFTRKYKTLPPPPPSVDMVYNSLREVFNRYGLVYDSVNDDYKVLRSVNVRGKQRGGVYLTTSEAKVYSLKSNSWKVIMNCPMYGWWDILVHGALHTINHKLKLKLIICFDLVAEERYEILLPKGFLYTRNRIALFALKGLLGFSCLEDTTIDLWIMKEYRVEESWVKLLSLTPPTGDRIVFPVTYSDNGRKVLLHMKKDLVWFDLECKTFYEVFDASNLPFRHGGLHAEVCVETLISPDGYGENENKCWINLQQEEEEECAPAAA